jgi:formamidopyrimidine-DNA glycosylase
MPEIPDLEAYINALRSRVLGQELKGVRLGNPFLLRTVDPPLSSVEGRMVIGIERIGKRLVFALDDDLFLVLHLMIAGRLHWKRVGAAIPKGAGLVAFDFAGGTLLLTEAGKTRRASLHLVRGRDALAAMDPGGLEVMAAGPHAFAAALAKENRTLKRALSDPHTLAGIGNAYSDEILHRARLSPFKLTGTLTQEESERLYAASRAVLSEWTDRLCAEAGDEFPEKVTAFRPEMAVHGRYGRPCPVCGARVQRIAYAENECNYCPGCQTEGRIYADRALSRLLKDDWPRELKDLERGG